ncbi:MAG: epoxyqueuosine reductase QueH [Candidatus Omnitrophota bacterium]|nr:epoxyqueuosine reductase QueH [Candidatus Omnitrophota bacterium]
MKLLLHICCGPCALHPIRELLDKKFDKITGFFYNPNIHPPSEYKRRKDALSSVGTAHCAVPTENTVFEIIYPEYKMEEYFKFIFSNNAGDGLKPSPAERCGLCWELRLSKTVDFAKANGFDAFTTTLLISPYQDHEKVKKIGEKIASEKGVQFYYQDFRPGFRNGQEQAKKENLYRQKYCGCVFSELERVKV